MFAVRTEVLRLLFSDAEWADKLNKAKSVEEIAEILARFGKAKGYKVARLKLGNFRRRKA